MTDKMYQFGYLAKGLSDEEHRAHLAELNRPFKGNPLELFAPTKVRVLRAFCIKGTRVEPGKVVSVDYHLARDLAAAHKAIIVP